MIDASFANNHHEQPSCFLDLNNADCLFIRHDEDSLMFVYYWYADDNVTIVTDKYCLMMFSYN